jgi:glycogen operon protein
MGDEVRRTQLGNNNGYCLDNDITWFDWTLISRHADVHRFLKLLIARRRLRDLYPEHQLENLNRLLAKAYKVWHGVKLAQPDWSPWSHSLVFGVEHPKEKVLFPRDPECILAAAGIWIDTALDSPKDIVEWKEAQSIWSQPYRAGSRSVAVLFANVGEFVP